MSADNPTQGLVAELEQAMMPVTQPAPTPETPKKEERRSKRWDSFKDARTELRGQMRYNTAKRAVGEMECQLCRKGGGTLRKNKGGYVHMDCAFRQYVKDKRAQEEEKRRAEAAANLQPQTDDDVTFEEAE